MTMRANKAIWLLMLALAIRPAVARAAGYRIALGEGQGEPGQVGSVPIYLDAAAGVASLEFQINYDAALLSVAGVTNPPGSLGEAFGLDYESDDGRLIVRLFRMEGLAAGNGLLCRVRFLVNAGAAPAMWGDLALASVSLSTQFGENLGWKNSVATENAKFWTVFSAALDSDGDGLSDYAEQMVNGSADYAPGAGDTAVDNLDTDGDGMADGWEMTYGLDPLAIDANGDADGDGLSNGQEASLGLNPNNADTDGDGYPDRAEFIAGTDGASSDDCLRLEVNPSSASVGRPIFSWQSETGRIYSVLRATNLLQPWTATPVFVLSGDGSAKSFTNENEQGAQLFYRLKVDLE